MIVQQIDRGLTVKTVTVTGVTDADTDDDVKRVAMTAANETPSSLFGVRLTRMGSVATVRLDTD